MARAKILFVCSRNQWRSPTAERVYRKDPRLDVRSRGLSSKSVRKLVAADLIWADVVFVMESSHRARIHKQMRDALGETVLLVLDIPDDYQFMDQELIDLIVDRVEYHLGRLM